MSNAEPVSNNESAGAETRRTRLLILADDLTGTADSAIGCARVGLETIVALDSDGIASAEAVAIDMDSRGRAPDEAAARHRQALATWRGRYRYLYKKVDSTLRGNVAAEIKSLVDVAGMAIVAPAYPATGRTTRDGRQWLHGRPVEETEVWTNEGITGQADLVAMLRGAALSTAHLDLDALNGRDEDVVATLREQQRLGIQAVVCDAETDSDLRRLATLSARLENVFWVGSAGLGERLPEALKLVGGMTCQPAPPPRTRPTLIVIGSMSAISHAQADALVDHAKGLEVIEIEAATLRSPAPQSAVAALNRRVAEALAEGRDVMVRLRQSEDRDAAEGPQLSLALGRLLAPHLGAVDRLIATGGATARALLIAADITELALLDAPDTGMARLYCQLGPCQLEVVTKAGGFGDTQAFQRVWNDRPIATASSSTHSPNPRTLS
ncbi:four-carbon acid sugar kinase family protein [Salinicola salarius]|uniref:four-carbon acid sugar kinase family protein n=1 Tax=Salinicola salarius TaxID=430457 RepID=UPI0023E3DA71|nr:four-carbon acid sugar kinase family protein [Salinicola salarius]MDF3919649.1 four-carbon acid sugar kinase family protein [Salinicola salarius]